MNTARKSVNGYMTIGTFSENGPTKCSGLEIKQYTEQTLSEELQKGFDKIRCITEDHTTPFNTTQNFYFVVSKDKKLANIFFYYFNTKALKLRAFCFDFIQL